MNWGEFVHFWSGAAGVNLKALATAAFGWPAEWETQFNNARTQFPFTYGSGVVTVYKDCNFSGTAVSLGTGSYTLAQLQALGIVNDDISSLRVQSGYRATLYWDDNFQGATLAKTADDNCLVDDGWNDKVSSIVIAALSPQPIASNIEVADKTFTIYPVPAKDQLNINTIDDITGGSISVFDVMGKQVMAPRAATRRVDVSQLPAGSYILVYRKNEKLIRKQFTK
jgi:hypothetical protein